MDCKSVPVFCVFFNKIVSNYYVNLWAVYTDLENELDIHE